MGGLKNNRKLRKEHLQRPLMGGGGGCSTYVNLTQAELTVVGIYCTIKHQNNWKLC